MNRVEFMEELEKLLCCISEEERNEALEYYEAYFEDAGKEKESEVIKELKSPKKVAESIKAGLRGEDRAIYTERGYEEEKVQNENHNISLKKQPVTSGKISLEKENTEQGNFSRGGEASPYSENGEWGYGNQYTENNQQGYVNTYENDKDKYNHHIIAIIIAVITSPIWGSILLAVLGGIIGLIGGMIGIIAGIFSGAFALIVCGIAAVLHGFITLTSVISLGLLEIGIGFLCIGGGGMLLWAGILLVTRAIPSFIKWIIKKVKKIFHKEGDYVS